MFALSNERRLIALTVNIKTIYYERTSEQSTVDW